MGNQKSLYKTYFNEVYLKREETKDQQLRSHSGIEDYYTPALQEQSSTESSRQTPDNLLLRQANNQLSVQHNSVNSGRTTSELTRKQLAVHSRYQKTFKVLVDQNYTLIINIPERLVAQSDDDSSIHSGATSQLNLGQLPTCGWLLEQVEKQYAQLIKELKQNPKAKANLRKKLIVALKTVDKNETIDYWLTQYQRPLKPLPSGLVLEPHYSKIIYNKPKAVCVNDFEMLKVIGKGGFSKVYMVRKKDTGLIYAMKVMKKDQVTNESKLKQIMNERTIMEQLADHPFIIKLHYGFQSKENLHFVIDFCTGGEMFYHLQKNGRFPEFLAKFYFAEILLGIEFLHSKNIVYRDLKPENVLIEVDGHIKLADFGLSKQFKRDERSFSYCGSPEYMCPEILKREGHNHMVDYYTLGAILYEMLTGLPPYYTNNKCEMTKRILDAELTFPSHVNPDAANLMKALLERNPFKRLGQLGGVEEIKQHEWCKDIDWNMILQKKFTPPWKPRLDQSNFDPEYTQLPLNFDDNFKRALQGDREFSFYYESPCQSLTVTEHSIYASNPDLSNAEIFLQSGSSKKLLEHFYQQQPSMFSKRQPSILMGHMNFNEIMLQQQQILEMNNEMALKINQNLMRDESILSLEYNQESGLTNFRGFSFFGESEEEHQVKRQIIKYTKLRNKLNLKLKQIQDEEGIIRHSHLKNICLSSPNSSLGSIACQTVLPTPPVFEESSSRNSQPSNKVQMHTDTNSSCSPFLQAQPKHFGTIDKTLKQQLIISKLEENKIDRQLFKSFQTEQQLQKKDNLFRSNIDVVTSEPFALYKTQQSLQDSSVQSMKDVSSNDESVAEERESDEEGTAVHQSKTYPNQNLTSMIDHYMKTQPAHIDQHEYILEEQKEEMFLDDEQDVKNVKFILFQSQNVHKSKTKVSKTDKGLISKQLLNNPKRVGTQRSRPGQKDKKNPGSNQDKTNSILGTTQEYINKILKTQNQKQSSSVSNANTSSREQHLEKTGTDYESTKHTFDHQSIKSNLKKTFEEENQSSFNDQQQKANASSQIEDLDKTANIIYQQEAKKQIQYSQQISPLSKRGAQTTKKETNRKIHVPSFARPNLEIEIESPQLSRIHLKQGSSEYYFGDGGQQQELIRIPQTMKYADKGKEELGFESQFERSGGNLKSAKQTPKASAIGFSFSQQKQLAITAKKKISLHYKQISADFNLFQHDDFVKKPSGSAYQAIRTQLTLRTSLQTTSTPKSVKGLLGPSPTNKLMQKKINDDAFKADTQLQELLAQSGKKDSVISKSSGKQLKTNKAPSSMKKGIPSTASTITLPRALTSDNVMIQPPLSTKHQKVMKPPLSKQGEGTVGSINNTNSTIQYSGMKKASQNSYSKILASSNTPTSQKIIVNQKQQVGNTFSGSAKNAQAQKFTFPNNEAPQVQSPRKLERKMPKPLKSQFSNSKGVDSSSQKKTSTDSDKPRTFLIEPFENEEKEQEQHNLVFAKPPKTTMHKSSPKGFFQQ